MNYSMYIPLISLINLVIVAIFYFSKDRLKSMENKIYSSMIIANIIGLILDFLSIAVAKAYISPGFLSLFIIKTYLVYLLTYQILMTLYIYVITRKEETKYKLRENKIMRVLFFFYFISIVVFYYLELNVFSQAGRYYSYGMGTVFLYALFAVLIIFWFVLLIKNYKHISKFKLIPVFSFLIIGSVVAAIQYKYPWMLLITSAEALITILMFHTIENPDLKLIKQMEIAMIKTERSNKAKQEFLTAMSHEIRTPLNAIMSLGDLIISQDNDAKPIASVKEDLKDIYRSSEDLLNKVNSILDVQKLETNDFKLENQEYNLRELIDELIQTNINSIKEKNLEFRFFYDNTIPAVLYGDKNGIKQVLLNFLTNAVKYTDTGFIELKVHSLRQSGHCQLILTIRDSGKGLSEDKIANIFDKFVRLGEEQTTLGGFGLGLAISKRIAELMNGQITVASDGLNKGSSFTYTVVQKIISQNPLQNLKDEKPQENKLELPKLSDEKEKTTNEYKGKKILVVDDNKLNLKVAQRLLSAYEIEVDLAISGEECLKMLEPNKYDILFLDIMMPFMNGVELLNKINKNPKIDTPMVALTADSVAGAEKKYLSLGFNSYLEKPIIRDKLETVLEKYLS